MREVYLATIPYDAQVKHDGHLYCFHIPALHVNKCQNCNLVTFDSTTDEEISQGLRDERHLLSPRDIRKHLERFGWKQKDLADHLGTTPETVSRWLTGGHIQSRVMDKSMRNLFELEDLRQAQRTRTSDVVVSAGELVPWRYSLICPAYQMPVAPMEGEIIFTPPLLAPEMEMSCETARGPPAYAIVLPEATPYSILRFEDFHEGRKNYDRAETAFSYGVIYSARSLDTYSSDSSCGIFTQV